jgi:predicted PurR-regulated permease PerM
VNATGVKTLPAESGDKDVSRSRADRHAGSERTGSTRKHSELIFSLVLLAFSLILAGILLRFFWRPIAFALVIGIGLYPVHLKIRKVLSQRNTAALVSTLLVLLIFAVSIAFVTFALSGEIIRAAQYMGRKTNHNSSLPAAVLQPVNQAIEWLGGYVDLEKTGLRSTLNSLPARISQVLFAAATALITSLASFITEGAITLFIVFFVFRDGSDAARWVAGFLPMEREHLDRLLLQIRDIVFANLHGILAVAFAQGFLTDVAFALLGIPSPVLFGICAALFSLVPLVGPALVWLPGSIFLFATGHWVKGLFLLGWGTLAVGLADNVVRPLVIAGRVKLHPLILLFALIGGVQQFGFVGFFIGPLVMSLALVLIDVLQTRVRENKHLTADAPPGSNLWEIRPTL